MHLVSDERPEEDQMIISHVRKIIRQTAGLKPVTGYIPAGSSVSEQMGIEIKDWVDLLQRCCKEHAITIGLGGDGGCEKHC